MFSEVILYYPHTRELKIEETLEIYEDKINGVRKVHQRNDQPETFENVKVYACDQHDYVADAEIRNFETSEIAVESVYPNIPGPTSGTTT